MGNKFSKAAKKPTKSVPGFRSFADLPPEIRLLIWEESCRDPGVPGVHFLSSGHLGLSDPGFVGLDVPRPVHDSRPTYLCGQALWNVCLESRAVMLRIYGDDWARIRPGTLWQVGPGFADEALRESEAKSLDHTLGELPIVVLPKQDLFVLDTVVPPSGLDNEITLASFSTILAGKKLSHIGVMIDPSNNETLQAANSCRSLACPKTCPVVWIIYHGMRRVSSPEPHRQFFEGNGCRLTEFFCEDTAWLDTGRIGSEFDIRDWLHRTSASAINIPECPECKEVHPRGGSDY